MNVPFILSLAAGILQCSDTAAGHDPIAGYAGGDCEDGENDETFLLQSMKFSVRTAAAIKSGEACYPCEIWVKPPASSPEFKLDIYVPNFSASDGPLPVVLAHHGSGGDNEAMEQCTYVFASAGFLCASLDPISTPQRASDVIDHAIDYLKVNAALYNADANAIILYGHSEGGRSVFEYMFFSEAANRNSVKGFIQDGSSDSADRFDWQEKFHGAHLRFPPLLMLHCEADPTEGPERSVEKTVPKIDKANRERADHEQVVYHYMKFSANTGCEHPALLVNSWDGADAAVCMIRSIMDGDENPFLGFPAEISGAGTATGTRRRRGEPNWP